VINEDLAHRNVFVFADFLLAVIGLDVLHNAIAGQNGVVVVINVDAVIDARKQRPTLLLNELINQIISRQIVGSRNKLVMINLLLDQHSSSKQIDFAFHRDNSLSCDKLAPSTAEMSDSSPR